MLVGLLAAATLETLLPALARDDARIEQAMGAGGFTQTSDQTDLDRHGKVIHTSQQVLRFDFTGGRLVAKRVASSTNGRAWQPKPLPAVKARARRRDWLPMPSPFRLSEQRKYDFTLSES